MKKEGLLKEGVQQVPLSAQINRLLFAKIYGTLIPAKISELSDSSHKNETGWRKAIRLLREGNGLVIAHTHLSKGEPPRVVKTAWVNPLMRGREFAVPVALHQLKSLYQMVGTATDSSLFPIVTAETIRVRAEQELPPVDRVEAVRLMDGYLTGAVEILSGGGVAIVAPQGTREPRLRTNTTAISTLVNRAVRQDVTNIAVVFVGVEVSGTQDYAKLNPGMNYLLPYTLRVGRCRTVEDLLAESQGNLKVIDEIARQELLTASPKEYRPN